MGRTTLVSNMAQKRVVEGVVLPLVVPTVAVYLFVAAAGTFGVFSLGLTLATKLPKGSASLITLSVCGSFCGEVNCRKIKRTGTIVFLLVITAVSIARLVVAQHGRIRGW